MMPESTKLEKKEKEVIDERRRNALRKLAKLGAVGGATSITILTASRAQASSPT